MIKKYQAKRALKFSMDVTVEGVTRQIEFVGGTNSPYYVKGYYITDDEKLQDAMETHPMFGDNLGFILVEEIKKDISVNPVIQGTVTTNKNPIVENLSDQEKTTPPEEPVIEISEEKEEEVAVQSVGGITNAQKAKEWLKKNKNATNSEVKNVNAINDFCKTVGVVFPDWVQK